MFKDNFNCTICFGLVNNPLICDTCENIYCNKCITITSFNICPYKCVASKFRKISRLLLLNMEKIQLKCEICKHNCNLLEYHEHRKECRKTDCLSR